MQREMFIAFKCKYFEVTTEDYGKLQFAYNLSGRRLRQELIKMELWLDANPRKKKKNYKKFIANWLNRKNRPIKRADPVYPYKPITEEDL